MARRSADETAAISARLRDAMAAKNLELAQLGRLACEISGVRFDTARPILHHVAASGRVPRDAALRDGIARALGVTPGWLFFGTGPRHPRAPSMLGTADTDTGDAPDSAEVARGAVPAVPAPPAAAVSPSPATTTAPTTTLRLDPAGYGVVVVTPDLSRAFEPFAGNGDTVFVAPATNDLAVGSRVLVVSPTGDLGLYRLVGRDGDAITLTSPSGAPVRLPAVASIHRVAAVSYA